MNSWKYYRFFILTQVLQEKRHEKHVLCFIYILLPVTHLRNGLAALSVWIIFGFVIRKLSAPHLDLSADRNLNRVIMVNLGIVHPFDSSCTSHDENVAIVISGSSGGSGVA